VKMEDAVTLDITAVELDVVLQGIIAVVYSNAANKGFRLLR